MSLRVNFDNRYPDFTEEHRCAYIEKDTPFVNEKTKKWVKRKLDLHLNQIQEWVDLSTRQGQDYTVYSGYSGFALLYLNMSESPTSYSRKLIQKALLLVETPLEGLSGRNFSFLTGDCGPLAIAAVMLMRHGERQKAISLMEKIKQYSSIVCDLSRVEMTDDLFSGRAGYLYTLLFVHTHIEWQNVITVDMIRKVVEAIIRSGQERAAHYPGFFGAGLCFASSESPQDPYLGVLHGQAGVLHTLLQACKLCSFDDLDSVLKTALLFMLSRRLSSRHYPLTVSSPSTASTSAATVTATICPGEELVQWCHGAGGLCMLFCTSYLYFAYDRKVSDLFLREAISLSDLVWERGLLVKGYGLCHGVAGNAYALLRTFQITKKEMYLHRAFKFAEHCFDYNKHNLKNAKDFNSLFEGIAGSLYLISDMLSPRNSLFPGFQVMA